MSSSPEVASSRSNRRARPVEIGVETRTRRSATDDRKSDELSRAHGCLLGMAVGDAFGARYEFSSAPEVAAQMAKDWIAVGRRRATRTDRDEGTCAPNHDDAAEVADGEVTERKEKVSGGGGGGTAAATKRSTSATEKRPTLQMLPMLGGGSFWLARGQPTDDSEMAFALVHSLLRRRAFDVDDVAQCYAVWFESEPFDHGESIASALADTEASASAALNGAKMRRAAAVNNSERLSNGALMRIAPLAVARFSADRATDRALKMRFCAQECALTHPNPAAVDTSCAYVAALDAAIAGGCSRSEIHETALAHAATAPVRFALTRARDAAQSVEFPADGERAGYLGVALQNAFHQLLVARDFAAAIDATVRLGGDTDTNAAIAGALCGAYFGAAAIPVSWHNAVVRASVADSIVAPDSSVARSTPSSVAAAAAAAAAEPRPPSSSASADTEPHRTIKYPWAAYAGSCRSLAVRLRDLALQDAKRTPTDRAPNISVAE